MRKIDLTGKVIGRLTVMEFVGSKIVYGRTRRVWKCKCSCGNTIEHTTDQLLQVNSCGCIRNEKVANLNKTHGEANKSPEYKAWRGMKERCYSPSSDHYNQYGNRGISVCERWVHSYENFLMDMGRKPDRTYSIDRVNNDGNYTPENCRWATKEEQDNNKQATVKIEFRGKILSMKQWSRELGCNYKWLHAQLKYKNKTMEDLFDEGL